MLLSDASQTVRYPLFLKLQHRYRLICYKIKYHINRP